VTAGHGVGVGSGKAATSSRGGTHK
jgi:hypothetical protein